MDVLRRWWAAAREDEDEEEEEEFERGGGGKRARIGVAAGAASGARARALAHAATARWGGGWNARRDDTFRKDDDPGVAIRRIAARLRAETTARGDERPGRELAAETTPSRKPLLAEYY